MPTRVETVQPSVTAASVPRFGRLEPLTGLRGVAACSVLIAHAIDISFYYGGHAIFHPVAARLAYFGMALFFVLSGFVIQYNYAGSFASGMFFPTTWRFFVARFARLYPLYLVSLICSLTYIPPPTFGARVALAYLTLTQSWLNVQRATFAPDWSISAEWFFYVAFIPLTFIIMRLRYPTLALLILCVLGAIGIADALQYWRAPLIDFIQTWFWHRTAISDEPWLWITYYAPYLRVFEFLAGMLAAKAYKAHAKGGAAPIMAWLVMLLALAWCAAVIGDSTLTQEGTQLRNILTNFIFAPALAPLMLCLCRYDSALGRLLSCRPAAFLGEISYSIYIWSFFVMTMMTSYFVSVEESELAYVNSAVKMAVTFGLTVVFAYGSYALIEAPSRRWLRRVLAGSSRESGGLTVCHVTDSRAQPDA
jgi:peptidoglycan/LPS O-acetylase OafA/YrhL